MCIILPSTNYISGFEKSKQLIQRMPGKAFGCILFHDTLNPATEPIAVMVASTKYPLPRFPSRYYHPIPSKPAQSRFGQPEIDCHVAGVTNQRPIDISSYLITSYTRLGEGVISLCAGSGTDAIAAAMFGRSSTSIESDFVVCQQARERLGLYREMNTARMYDPSLTAAMYQTHWGLRQKKQAGDNEAEAEAKEPPPIPEHEDDKQAVEHPANMGFDFDVDIDHLLVELAAQPKDSAETSGTMCKHFVFAHFHLLTSILEVLHDILTVPITLVVEIRQLAVFCVCRMTSEPHSLLSTCRTWFRGGERGGR